MPTISFEEASGGTAPNKETVAFEDLNKGNTVSFEDVAPKSPIRDLLRAVTGAMFGNAAEQGTPLGPVVMTDAGDFYKDAQGNLKVFSGSDFIAEDPKTGELKAFSREKPEGTLAKARAVSSAVVTGLATTAPEGTFAKAARVASGVKGEAVTAEKPPEVPTTPEAVPPVPKPTVTPEAEVGSAATPEQRLVGDLSTRGMNAALSTPELEAIRQDAMVKLRALDQKGLGATEPIVKETLSRDVNQSILEMLQAGEVQLAPDIKISDQVRDLLQTNILKPEEFQGILAKNGVDPVRFLQEVTQGELGQSMRSSATQSARTLQKLGELQKAALRIRALSGEKSDEVAAFLRGQDASMENGVFGTMRRIGNIWRGALVSQLGTAVRNYETAVGRIGVDVLSEGLEQGLRSIFVNPIRQLAGKEKITEPLTAFGNFVSLVGPRKAMGMIDEIAKVKPSVREDLFGRYASDVNKATGGGGILGKIEGAVNFINFFNRTQEKMVRAPVFAAELRQRLAVKGLNLDKLVADNRIGSIPEEDIKASIEKSMEMAWGRPLGNDAISETVRAWDKFVTLGGRLPNVVTPFTRFMADALRFQYEYSPLGATRLLKPAEVKGLLSGEPAQMKVASKALAGSAFLYGAYMLRKSEYAGPNWFEIKLPDGRTIDTRPFAPFSNYLFVADIIKRMQEGTLLGMSSKELAQGLIGVNFRAGAGLFLVDDLFTQLSGVSTAQKMGEVVKRYAGNVLGGFTVPFQTLKDMIGQFVPEERIVRDVTESPLTGPALTRIPFAAQNLPEVESPTRAGPYQREAPMLRQITGIGLRQAPNAAEAELTRLGFSRREILPPTGDLIFDRLMAKHLGPLVENVVGAVVQSPGYRKLDNNFAKAELIRNVLPKVRDLARAGAYEEDVGAQIRLKYQRLPRRQRALIENILSQKGIELNLP